MLTAPVYMQKRYTATLALHGPQCGYALEGVASERCPECGEAVPVDRGAAAQAAGDPERRVGTNRKLRCGDRIVGPDAGKCR